MESSNPQVGEEGLTTAPGYPPQEQGNSEEGAPPPVIDVPQYTGEMPDEDLDENPEAVPPEITPPSLDKMDTIEGYQNIGFSGDFLPPPPFAEVTEVPEDRKNVTDVAILKEDEARQALRLYVGDHFCFGKGPVEELTFIELQTSSAFHYTLDSFTEARSTEWACKPYKGGHIDGPENGPAPGPWDIPTQCEELFKDEKKNIEVPHTASVKPCHNCFATGFIRCWRCEGRGRNRCISCQGSGKGMQEEEKCFNCSGEGTKRMKTVILKNVYAVGMHHWGSKELCIGTTYFCEKEESNPWDRNAVAVFGDSGLKHKVCYLQKEDAKYINQIFGYLKGKSYQQLKTQMGIEKYSKYKGPQQNCNIEFECENGDIPKILSFVKSCYEIQIN